MSQLPITGTDIQERTLTESANLVGPNPDPAANPQVPQAVQGQVCCICGAPATEWLLFKSQYRQSTVDFCSEHFLRARQIFEAYVLDKKPIHIETPVKTDEV